MARTVGGFDAEFYLARNTDVAAAGIDPLTHYRRFGFREGRDPNAFFDALGYLARNPDVAAAGFEPLDHFNRFGFREGRAPSDRFNLQLYLARNTDVAAAGIDPLQHYLDFGRAEGRRAYSNTEARAFALFDQAFYLAQNTDVAAAGIDPFNHYLDFGTREGRNPNAFFDVLGYAARYPDVAATGINPLADYVISGARAGRVPSAAFDPAAYLALNTDVAAAGLEPLAHYLRFGIFEGRAIGRVAADAANDLAAVNEAVGRVGNAQVVGNVLRNDLIFVVDPTRGVIGIDGGALEVPVAGVYGSIVLGRDGRYTYTLNDDDPQTSLLRTGEVGVESFTYTIRDAAGRTDSATLTINVAGRDDALALRADVINTSEASVRFNVFDNDDGVGLTVRALQNDRFGVQPGELLSTAFGSVRVEADGGATFFQPGNGLEIGAGQTIAARFQYNVTDANGAFGFATVTVNQSRPATNTVSGTPGADTLFAFRSDTVVNGGDGDDVIQGSYGDDTLRGGNGNDTLTSLVGGRIDGANVSGRDVFRGGGGNDTIIGSGRDIAIFTGARNGYSVTRIDGVTTVRDVDLTDGDEGTDTLVGVRVIQFADADFLPNGENPGFFASGEGVADRAINVAGGGTVFSDSASQPPFFSMTPGPLPLAVLGTNGQPAPSWISYDAATLRLVIDANAAPLGLGSFALRPGPTLNDPVDPVRVFLYTPQAGDRVGTTPAERIEGTTGADRVFNLGRGDVVVASAGADVYARARNADYQGFSSPAAPVVDYSASPAGIVLDLVLGIATGGFAEGDIILGINSVVGSAFNDTIIAAVASADPTVIDPGAGDDIVFATADTSSVRVLGSLGADRIDSSASFLNVDVDYRTSTAAVSVNLVTNQNFGGFAEGDRLGRVGTLWGSAFDDTIVRAATAEGFSNGTTWGGNGNDRLIGASGFDQLNGEAGNDELRGGEGTDVLTGGAGADILDGGTGIDTARYEGFVGVTVDLLAGTGSGGDAQGDTLIEIENINGSQGSDTLLGDDRNNTLEGNGGDDRIFGRGGDDVIGLFALFGNNGSVDGGTGNDTLRGDLTLVDLTGGIARFNSSSVTVSNIENVELTSAGTIIGNNGVNIFGDEFGFYSGDLAYYGRGGNDVFYGGNGNDLFEGGTGADAINGRGGSDTATYATSTAAVRVDLRSGIGAGGEAAGDILTEVENLIGSAFNDILAGTANVTNSLSGEGGDDILLAIGGDALSGGAGADLLVGGTGDGGSGADLIVARAGGTNRATGGTGADTFIAATTGSTRLDATIVDFSQGEDRLDLSDLFTSPGVALTVVNVAARSAAGGAGLTITLDGLFAAGGEAVTGAILLSGVASTLGASSLVLSNGIAWETRIPADLPLGALIGPAFAAGGLDTMPNQFLV